MRSRAGLSVALVAVVLSLVAAGCSNRPAESSAPTSSTAPSTTSTTVPPAGKWSKALKVAPGADLSVVSCPAASVCLMGSTTGQTYRLGFDKVVATGPAAPAPSPQGVAYLSCGTASFCAAAPNADQVAFFNGTTWAPPTTISGAKGITAIDCTGPTFCMTIDGEGNSFEYDGQSWSRNLGAWGAANQISCASPSFCVAAEGGPSVWDGRAWTQPTNVDTRGQLNAVSCASTAFCVLVDSSGAVLTWNGQGFSGPTAIATELPQAGTDISGLTSVSCPTATFCRAVDSLGRVFGWNGTAWSGGTLIDNHGLTSISCPTITYCVTVDREGNAFISS